MLSHNDPEIDTPSRGASNERVAEIDLLTLQALLIPEKRDTFSIADRVYGDVTFDRSTITGKLICGLLDREEPIFSVQQMKERNQLGNARAAFPNANHTRFEHSVCTAYLLTKTLDGLKENLKVLGDSDRIVQLEGFRPILAVTALLHDIGHISPGSHVAQEVWSPDGEDLHEELSIKIIREDPQILTVFQKYEKELSWLPVVDGKKLTLAETVCAILSHDSRFPAWTHQIISGGGWNVDRGDFVARDGSETGVSANYKPSQIVKHLRILPNGELAVDRGGVSAVFDFMNSRAKMYEKAYHHKTTAAADKRDCLIGKRVKQLFEDKRFEAIFGKGESFKSESLIPSTLKAVLSSSSLLELDLKTLLNLDEGFWQTCLKIWRESSDPVLRELTTKPLKAARQDFLSDDNELKLSVYLQKARVRCTESLPKHIINNADYFVAGVSLPYKLSSDIKNAMRVCHTDAKGRLRVYPFHSAGVGNGEQRPKRYLFVTTAIRNASQVKYH